MPPVQEDHLEQALTRWRKAVAGVLAKGGREVPGTEPERVLDTETYEGFAIRPLYTALDARPEDTLPGSWPFTRGADAQRDVLAGWKVAEEFPAQGCDGPAAANAAILEALVNGVSALVLRVGPGGIATADLDRALQGVYLDLAPVVLSAPDDFGPAASALLDLVGGTADQARPGVSVDLGADPLTAGIVGSVGASGEQVSAQEVVAVAGRAIRCPGVRTVTVDGPALHDRGASAGWELAGVIAAAIDYLRLLTRAGIDIADALGQVSFRLVADDDQFMTIAKFRAARRLWARVGEVLGCPDAAAARIHAVTSAAMMTRRDPWVNMLRTTVAAFGAGVGGADTVQVLGFDSAVTVGYPGVAAGFSRRIARNSQLLLLEESNLGRVIDPGAGSWYVEDLTDTLAEKAWANVRAIESRGGFQRAREYLTGQIDLVAGRRRDDIAHRRKAITGVSEFPNLAEPALPEPGQEGPDLRYAAAFEELRCRSDAFLARTGARPTVLLLPIGPLAEHNVRVTFATNVLASGGIEAVNPGTVAADGVETALGASGASVVVICGTDTRYAVEAGPIVAAARAAGCGLAYLAGPEKAVADTPSECRPDGFLNARIDAVQTLSALLTRLGA